VIFREVGADYASGWHTPPSPLYLIVMDGEIQIETGRHQIRVFGPGAVILAMDLIGRGHSTRAVAGRPVRSLVVPDVQLQQANETRNS
jgi:quercetin dioxygenase-like cupin family protein